MILCEYYWFDDVKSVQFLHSFRFYCSLSRRQELCIVRLVNSNKAFRLYWQRCFKASLYKWNTGVHRLQAATSNRAINVDFLIVSLAHGHINVISGLHICSGLNQVRTSDSRAEHVAYEYVIAQLILPASFWPIGGASEWIWCRRFTDRHRFPIALHWRMSGYLVPCLSVTFYTLFGISHLSNGQK